jgi:hypothetical protein
VQSGKNLFTWVEAVLRYTRYSAESEQVPVFWAVEYVGDPVIYTSVPDVLAVFVTKRQFVKGTTAACLRNTAPPVN